MPSVMDAPELSEYVETHDLTIERELPQPRRAHPGFWRTRSPRTCPLHLRAARAGQSRHPWTGSYGSPRPSRSMPLRSSDGAHPPLRPRSTGYLLRCSVRFLARRKLLAALLYGLPH
jgi:hypothetical protein